CQRQNRPLRRSDPVHAARRPPSSHPSPGNYPMWCEGKKRGRWRALVEVGSLDGSAADQQVIEDADDRQDQQQVDEGPGDMQRKAEQPQHKEDDDDGPDQARHEEPPGNELRRYVIMTISCYREAVVASTWVVV